ncbi:MAG: DMT family transporter [Geovibrio sp.]|nr:DMT family transporter [Geovibrio sp.]
MLRGIVYSLLSALCFSTLVIIAKFGFDSGMSSAQMLFYRFAFGALTTAAFLISTGRKNAFIIERRTLVKIVLIGGTMFLPQSFFFILSIKYIPVVTAELVLYFYPTAVVLISWLVLKKSLNRLHLIAAAVAFAGSALILFEAFSSNMSLTGLLLAMMAMLTFFLIHADHT